MSYLFSVIPLARLPRNAPQVLSYSGSTMLHAGALVRIRIGNRGVKGLIVSCTPIAEAKATIKTLPYTLRPIDDILLATPLLFRWQLQMIHWIARHYYEPLSLVARSLIPAPLLRRKTLPSTLREIPNNRFQESNIPKSNTPRFLQTSLEKRLEVYQDHIKENVATLILCPDQRRRDAIADALTIPTFDASLSDSILMERWNAIRSGNLPAVVGTRSAVMAPFPAPPTVIVEQESNDNHTSWDQHPTVDVRRIAEYLAARESRVIIGDPYPTQERTIRYSQTWKNPTTTAISSLVDMQTTDRSSDAPALSFSLVNALTETIENNERVLLFVTRRGSATMIICDTCGHVVSCPQCDLPLVLHTAPHLTVRCHTCNSAATPPARCPDCSATPLRYAGAGTQRIAQALRQLMPAATVIRVDSDADSTAMEQAGALENGGIVVGTELLLTHPALPTFALTAAVTIETLLHLPDYTSTERLVRILSLLRQRAEKRFLVQTYQPQHPAVQYTLEGTLKEMTEHERHNRQQRHYPPFGQLTLCRFIHKNEEYTEHQATGLARRLRDHIARRNLGNRVSLLGPSPGFRPKAKGRAHRQIVIKWYTEPNSALLPPNDIAVRNELLALVPPEWEIVVDPVSIL